jgi:hypothetical protein
MKQARLHFLFSLLAVLLLGYCNVPDACADAMKNLPILSGAKEKPCREDEKGACIENPTFRMEVVSTGSVAAVAKQLLLMSKKQGWKMIRVLGAHDVRYQSLNSKGFSLLWSIEEVGPDSDKSKQQEFYHIYYWKIYGE